jgi:hypothetical protein
MKRVSGTGGRVTASVRIFACRIQNKPNSNCQIEIRYGYGTDKHPKSVINIFQLVLGQ